MTWTVEYTDGNRVSEKKWATKEQANKYAERIERIGWVIICIKKEEIT
jgi:hypothetical protein